MPRFYSQNGEDVILHELFKDKAQGFFVEVGCIDGKRFSNTLTLEERGWRGLCVEAHADYVDLLRENRPNSIIAHCAAGEKDKDGVAFFANPRGSLSTLDASKEEHFRINYGNYFSGFKQQVVTKRRLDSLFQQYGIQNIDVLSLDIEGYEVQALLGIDFHRYKPAVLVIESDGPDQEQAIDNRLSVHGYTKIYRLSENLFYLAETVTRTSTAGASNKIRRVVTHTQHPLDRNGDKEIFVELDPLPYAILTEQEPPAPLAKAQTTGRMAVRERYKDIRERIREDSPVIVDAGANSGNVVDLFLKQYTSPCIHAFEPNPTLVEKLKGRFSRSSLVHIHPCALGSEAKDIPFHIINSGDSPSVFRPTRVFQQYHGDRACIERTITVPMVRLDEKLAALGTIAVIKLDLQGYELEALKGCGSLLKRTKIITTEIEFALLYEGQPLFSDIDGFLRDQNFYLLNLYELWTHPDGQLTAGGAVYLNNHFFPREKKPVIRRLDAVSAALSCKGWTDEKKLSKLFDLTQKVSGVDGDILEIGSAWGRSAVLFGLASRKQVYSIDPHTGGIACIKKTESQNSYEEFLCNISKHGLSSRVTALKMTTQEAVDKSVLSESLRCSLAFIDGLHTPDGVRTDFTLAFPRLVAGGIMAFDDYFEPSVHDYADAIDAIAKQYGLALVKDSDSGLVFFMKPSPHDQKSDFMKTDNLIAERLIHEEGDIKDGSVGITDPTVINAFIANPESHFLVSFPRTGSHWLRMLMEQYFGRPSLVRAFYYSNRADYLTLHTHDMELQVYRKNIIYLYRDPVDTVYSQLRYHKESLDDPIRVRNWSDRYGKHLHKWLCAEKTSIHKTIITYEGLKRNLSTEFAKLAYHFGQPLDLARLEHVAAQISKEEVKRKTKHDQQVVTLNGSYLEMRKNFRKRFASTVWNEVTSTRPQLKTYFEEFKRPDPCCTFHADSAIRLEEPDLEDPFELNRVRATAISHAKKIVGLVPARNEQNLIGQCLRALSRYTDAIVYLDDCSEDGSVGIVEAMAQQCRIERIIKKTEWYRDEPHDRNALLWAGREIGGTHFIVIDADELFTANCSCNDMLRTTVLALQPGERLELNWIPLWRNTRQYRFDQSIWTWNYKDFAFADDGKGFYSSDFLHTPRTPRLASGSRKRIEGYQYGVMHFQFVNWRNLLIKQAWYRCLERVRNPRKPAEAINQTYAQSTDETNIGFKSVPDEWLAGYEFFTPMPFLRADLWREKEVLSWFTQYGKEFFADLDIWSIGWGAGLTTTPALESNLTNQQQLKNQNCLETPSTPPRLSTKEGNLARLVDQEYSKACALAQEGRQFEAIEGLQAVIVKHPDYALAHNDLGVLYTKIAEHEKALKHYEQAVRLEPHTDLFRKNLADFYFQILGRLEDAITIYADVLSKCPHDLDVLIALGQISLIGGLTHTAGSYFARALRIDPTNEQLRSIVEDLNRKDALSKRDLAAGPKYRFRVTAIVSTYNAERFIRGKLEDLEAQTIADQLEIIVVDSGSPQNERAIVEEFQKRYSNIKYIKTDARETVYQAWNRGIRAASGEFITNANTDDRLRPDAIEVLVKTLDHNPDKVLAYGDSKVTLRENETFDRATVHSYLRWPDFDQRKLLESCFVGPHPLWRRSVHDEMGYFDERYQCAADYEFWLRLAIKHDFIHVAEPIGLYWLNEGTVSRKGDLPVREAFQIQKEYSRKYQAAHPRVSTESVKKRRVLLVTHNFPPHNYAGVEVYTLHHAKELIARDVDLSVFFPIQSQSQRPHAITKGSYQGVTTYTMAIQPEGFLGSITHPEKERVFRDFLERMHFDIVHFHHTHDHLPLSLILVAKHAGIPVVLTLHDFWMICPRTHLYQEETHTVCAGPEGAIQCQQCMLGKNGSAVPLTEREALVKVLAARQTLVRELLKAVDLIVTPSQFMADKFRQFGYGENRIKVFPLGVTPIPPRRKKPAGVVTFGYIGTIHKLKNIFWLVGVFHAISGDARLRIYGNGQPERIRQLADSIHDRRIEYKGSYTPDQLPDILSSMDIVIVPSLVESYCFTVREALSAGVPVIASRAGGIPEIVTHGQNGILVPPANRRELLKAVQNLVDNPGLVEHLHHQTAIKTIGDDADDWAYRYTQLTAGMPQDIIRHMSTEENPADSDQKPEKQGALATEKLTIGFLTAEPHSYACPYIRLKSPLSHLHNHESIELLHLGEIAAKEFKLNEKNFKKSDLIVVQRQFAALMPYDRLSRFVERSRQKIIYEMDDAFTEVPESHISYKHGKIISPFIKEYIKYADLVTVSTEMLRYYYRELNPNIVVIPNCLDLDLWNGVGRQDHCDGTVRVLFSGTPTHGDDLRMIEQAIDSILEEFKDKVIFLLWGNISTKFQRHSQVQVVGPFLSEYPEYAQALKNTIADFAIVPLEDNSFNQAKSHIKWLEYSACKIAGIYSNIGEYKTSISNGDTGILVNNTFEEWYQAIKKLIKDNGLRKGIAQRAYDEVMRHHTVAPNAKRWLNAYRHLPTKQREKKVKVSIIIPVFNKIDYTRKCLCSVSKNTPPELYEIILIDNGSTDGTKDFLRPLQGDAKIISNPKNLGFAVACNQGARAASGDYLLYLNNDTEPCKGWLEPLLEIADNDDSVSGVGSKLIYPNRTIQHAGIIIIDDKVKDDPLLARNYHVNKPSDAIEANTATSYQALSAACLLIRRAAFEDVGGFDEGYWNGYEDVDLCFSLRAKGSKIVYQPKSVVVHYESQSGPERFVKARENISRLHQKWLGKISPDFTLHADGTTASNGSGVVLPYHSMDAPRLPVVTVPGNTAHLVSIIILTFNQIQYTKECIESIRKHTPEFHEIIFVDNGSTDQTVKWLRKLVQNNRNYKLIENRHNLGFSKGCNQGIEASTGEYILLLNNDVVVTENWLSGMMEYFDREDAIGIVGAMTNHISGPQKVPQVDYASVADLHGYARAFRIQNRYRRIPNRRVVGFCMLFKRRLVDEIGLLDESFGSGNFEDDDFCLRACLAGYRNLIAGDVFIHHYGSRTFVGNKINYGSSLSRNRKVLQDKWRQPDILKRFGKRLIVQNGIFHAEEYFRKDELEKATASILDAIKQAPDERQLYIQLAQMLIEKKRFDDALGILASLPEKKADSTQYALMGYCHEALGNDRSAENDADQALALQPASALALNVKGVLAFKRNDRAAAEAWFRRAIESDPCFGESYTNLGSLKWEAGEQDEALEAFQRGFILSPTIEDVATAYQTAIVATKSFDNAERVAREARALHPTHKRLAFLMIALLLQQEKHEPAMSEIEKAMLQFGIDDGILSAGLEVRKQIGALKIDKSKSKRATLSVCMIVKNEEAHLAKCLMSVKPVVDEMIVVDTGSSDRSKDIAAALGARVFEYPWTNDFSEARNYSLAQASGDWILVLDADEVISTLDHGLLQKITKKRPSKHRAYIMVTRNYTNNPGSKGWAANEGRYIEEEAGAGWVPSPKVRLFVNDRRIRFVNPVHELVEPTLAKLGIPIRTCDVPVHHYGRLNRDKLMAKGKEYYRLGIAKIEQTQGDCNALKELAIQASEIGEYGEAVGVWQKVIERQPNDAVAYMNLGFTFLMMKQYANAAEFSKKAMAIDPELREAALNYAAAEMFAGDIRTAISTLEHLLEKHADYPPAMGRLAAAYIVSGRKAEGLRYLEKLNSRGFDCAGAWEEQVRAFISESKHEAAALLLAAAIEKGLGNGRMSQLMAECRSRIDGAVSLVGPAHASHSSMQDPREPISMNAGV